MSQTNSEVKWQVQLGGRLWSSAERNERWSLIPEKFEYIDGKLFWSEEDRINLLGIMLEQVGAEAAVRIGDLSVWKEAIAKAETSEAKCQRF